MRKLAISSRKILVFLLIFIFSTLVLAQSQNLTAPVQWQYYSGKEKKVSFLMPKLPVVVDESSACRGEENYAYGATAGSAAYVVRVTKKIDVPGYCRQRKEFDESNFAERVAFLKNSALGLQESPTKNPNEVTLTGRGRIHKLFDDYRNKRWVELFVVGADESKTEVKNFLASLKFGSKNGIIEIGDGSDRVLGDESTPKIGAVPGYGEAWDDAPDISKPQNPNGNVILKSKETPRPDISSNNGKTEGVQIVLKPRARYTDSARRNQMQGKVVLRVTFMANGGTGAISVISGLDDGLTEQAIAAARKILFVPAQRNDVPYSVVKPVEYIFSIY